MKITAYKCPFTGKVFEESKKKEYIKHLQEVRAGQYAKRAEQRVRNDFNDWIRRERARVRTVNELGPWFLENQRNLMDAHNAGVRADKYCSGSDGKFVNEDIFTKFEITLRGGFTESVSNSHVCPYDGVTNWGREDGKPNGYPGWHGDVSGVLKRPKKHDGYYPYGAVLNLAGFKTGSGGGGNASWGYGVSIFLSDWPGLQGQRDFEVTEKIRIAYEEEQERIVWRLKNAGSSSRRTTV